MTTETPTNLFVVRVLTRTGRVAFSAGFATEKTAKYVAKRERARCRRQGWGTVTLTPVPEGKTLAEVFGSEG